MLEVKFTFFLTAFCGSSRRAPNYLFYIPPFFTVVESLSVTNAPGYWTCCSFFKAVPDFGIGFQQKEDAASTDKMPSL